METNGLPTGWVPLSEAYRVACERRGYGKTSKAFLRQLRNINTRDAAHDRPVLRETTRPGARQPRYEVHFGRLLEVPDSPVTFDGALADEIDELREVTDRLAKLVKSQVQEVADLRKRVAELETAGPRRGGTGSRK